MSGPAASAPATSAAPWRTLAAGALAEWRQVLRAPLFLALVVAHALVLLGLVMLFALNGSQAPVAVVVAAADASAQPTAAASPAGEATAAVGEPVRAFIAALGSCHHSFRVHTADAPTAAAELAQGRILASITIPATFARALASGGQALVLVDIDNVDADLSEDIRRALPSAIVRFTSARDPAALSVEVVEQDAVDHETGFVPYLAVSGLVLDALALAAALAALAAARDCELGMWLGSALAPTDPAWLLGGRLLTAMCVTGFALLLPLGAVVAVAGVTPLHPLGLLLALGLSVAVGTALGAAVGLVVRASMPAAVVILGSILALYLDSGALEPQRFDGEAIWWLAHTSPAYPLVGLLEAAAHGLQVTPEPLAVDALLALAWLLLGLAVCRWRLRALARWSP